MPFSIVIPRIDLLIDALTRYPEIAEPIIKQATSSALLNLVPSLRDYPPELPNQRYIRTGDLGEGWADARPEWQAIPSGFMGTLENPVAYGPDVQGYTTQARIHANRWQTDQKIVEQHTLETEAIYEQALQDVTAAIDAQTGAP